MLTTLLLNVLVSEVPDEIVPSVLTRRPTHSFAFAQGHVFFFFLINRGHLAVFLCWKLWVLIVRCGTLSSVGLNTIINTHQFM